MRIGLISNRRSRRNKQALPDFANGPAARMELLHRPLEEIGELPAILDDLEDAKIDILAVNGGDGTISAVLGELLAKPRFPALPPLALLRGGTLNMTADDAGLPGRPAKALARLVEQVAAHGLDRLTIEREPIRVDYDTAKPPAYGFFFGTAAIYRGIVFCLERVHRLRLDSSVAAGATMAYMLGRQLLGGGGEGTILQGDDMVVRLDEGPASAGKRVVAFVTTLDRLMLGSRPYWGRESGPLHYTAIAHPPQSIGRFAYRILYGGDQRVLPADRYQSHNAERVSFEMACPFALDGEIYHPMPNQAVQLSGGGRLRLLRC